MNISSGDASCYPTLSPNNNLSLQMYSNVSDHHDDHNSLLDHHHHQANNGINNNDPIISPAVASSLLYSLSILKDKVNQLQSLLAIVLSPAAADPPSSSSSSSIASMNMQSAIQELIMTASSMLLTIQNQTPLPIPPTSGTHDNNTNTNTNNSNHIGSVVVSSRSVLGQPLMYPSSTSYDWTYGDISNQSLDNNDTTAYTKDTKYNSSQMISPKGIISSSTNYDIIELCVADLLAKYTHYCQVCEKGFKRDANLRMHMRAHGDKYKTNAALSNPMKKIIGSTSRDFPTSNVDDNPMELPKKYSCPQDGCRWNQRHAKFQPLKSMICVKNHYKRTHCPKMYMCKRCNRKQFSVLSDLRTHEKHCGDLKWQCSCGTTFSRKDKLMGHVALFHGHTPIMLNNSLASTNMISNNKLQSVVKIHITE